MAARLRNSAIGYALACLHFGYIFGVLATKDFEPYPGPQSGSSLSFSGWHVFGDMIAGRYFHHAYESLPTQIVTIVDFPSLLVGDLCLLPLREIVGPVLLSYMSAAAWLLLGSLQWYLIGMSIHRRRVNRHETPNGESPDA